MKSKIADRIKQLQWDNDDTQKALAEKSGINRNTLVSYMSGHAVPSVEKLIQLCRCFNVTADWLLGLSDVRKPDTTLQAICDYTGLTDEAAKKLNEQKEYQGDRLNDLFMIDDFWLMLDTITHCMALADQGGVKRVRVGFSKININAQDVARFDAVILLNKCIDQLTENEKNRHQGGKIKEDFKNDGCQIASDVPRGGQGHPGDRCHVAGERCPGTLLTPEDD